MADATAERIATFGGSPQGTPRALVKARGWTGYSISRAGKTRYPSSENTPLGRAGQPNEMAPAYVFLASTESSFVLGETLNANGGNPTP